MGLKSRLKARMAVTKQNKGETEEAMKLYKEAIDDGLNDANYLIAYSILLIRNNQYEEAKKVLVQAQKVPGLSPANKQSIHVNYAVCCYKTGNMNRALELLEYQHVHLPTSLVYQTYGYLLIEAGDFDKAEKYNMEALEYDDEDSIVLDNLGQTYYRLSENKEKAKEYFDKAIAIKPNQIDTLYFLSRYDLEKGDKQAAREKVEKALNGKFSPLNYVTRAQLEEDLKILE